MTSRPAAGVILAAVLPGSAAARAGLAAGDRILAVGGQPVEDALDLAYAVSEEAFTLTVARTGQPNHKVRLRRQAGEPWGGVAEPPSIKHCGNRCVFCFVDQMPEGLRSSLYVKDEDYRHSFLFGNYVTLTNLHPRDLERIKRLRLSPLYVSVHATDPEVRLRMLGRKRAPDILPILRNLIAAGIRLHTQAVVCPGWNDGKILEKTVDDLAGLYPGVASLALVPVGLTRHRRGLPDLAPVSQAQARALLRTMGSWQKTFLRRIGSRWVFATDEWYLRAGRPLPAHAAYEDYPQIENGVGITRRFVDEMACLARRLPREVSPRKILIPSGALAAPVVRRALQPWRAVRNLHLRVVAVPNRLFGATVTVTGLLTGADIVAALKPLAARSDLVILPPEPLRHRQLFLDNMTLPEFSKQLGLAAVVADSPRQLSRLLVAARLPSGRGARKILNF